MGKESAIEWTTHTFNPWWGCTKVSDGCKFCYAETWANRFGHDIWGPRAERRLMGNSYWDQPLRWNAEARSNGKRARVFCASMADVFEERSPVGQRERLWEIIRKTPWLDWQLLTKRPHRIMDCLPLDWSKDRYFNVWLGTSIENEDVQYRATDLIQVEAVVHFLSLEPLIGPLSNLPLLDIEWAIVGGESGQTPRPMMPEWVTEIQQQCAHSNVAFFFKQWGGVNKKSAGRLLGGQTYDALPTIDSSWLQECLKGDDGSNEGEVIKGRRLIVSQS